jgi:hypothetical protein
MFQQTVGFSNGQVENFTVIVHVISMSPWGVDHIFIPLLQEGALRMVSEDSQSLKSAMIQSLQFPRPSLIGRPSTHEDGLNPEKESAGTWSYELLSRRKGSLKLPSPSTDRANENSGLALGSCTASLRN